MQRQNSIKIRDEITHDMRLGRLSAKDPLPLDTQLAQAVRIGRRAGRRGLVAAARAGKTSSLQGCGPMPKGIGAPRQLVSADDAKTLKQRSDLPVFVGFAADATPDGHSIPTSREIWSAARVTFALEQSD